MRCLVAAGVVGVVLLGVSASGLAQTPLHLSGTVEYPAETYLDVTALTIAPNTIIRVRNGGTLTIVADSATIGDGVSITADGEPGPARTDRPSPPGDWTSSGLKCNWPKNCGRGSDAHGYWEAAVKGNKENTNNNVDRGHPGHEGLPGGQGGVVRLFLTVGSASPNVLTKLTAIGGTPGPGGQGGPGRLLKCGDHGSHIWRAADGPTGRSGAFGPVGRIELYLSGASGGTLLTAANKIADPSLYVGQLLNAADWAKLAAAERAKHPPKP